MNIEQEFPVPMLVRQATNASSLHPLDPVRLSKQHGVIVIDKDDDFTIPFLSHYQDPWMINQPPIPQLIRQNADIPPRRLQ